MDLDEEIIKAVNKHTIGLISYYYTINGNYIIIIIDSTYKNTNINNLYDELKNKLMYKNDYGYYKIITYPIYSDLIKENKYTTFLKFETEYYNENELYNNLLGPVSISEYYSSEYDMHIYLYGDKHMKGFHYGEIESIKIDDFIEKTIQMNKNVPIDIYLELPYQEKTTMPKYFESDISYIHDVKNKFYECLYKKDCKYPNLRVHYNDFRSIMNKEYIESYQIRGPTYILIQFLAGDWEDILYLEKSTEILLEKLRNVFLKSQHDNMFDLLYSIYDIHGKITKQYNNIKNTKIIQIIRKYYIDLYTTNNYNKKTVLKQLNDSISKINESDLYKQVYRKEEHEKIKQILINILIPILDVYLVGRLFRDYKETDKYSGIAKNSMIYVGQLHIINIRNILNLLGFKYINHVGITDIEDVDKMMERNEIEKIVNMQLNDISGFMQPFFYIHRENNKLTQIKRKNITELKLNHEFIDVLKRLNYNDSITIEVINKINPSKIKKYDNILFKKLYESKLPSQSWIDLQHEYISGLNKLDYSFIKLFVLGGYIYLNKYVEDKFTVYNIPDNLNIFNESYKLYTNDDINLVQNPVELEKYFMLFYATINKVLKNSPKSDYFTCYIHNYEQVDIYTNEEYNLDKYYFAELNTLENIDDNNVKTIMSITTNTNFLYYYGKIILPHFLNLTCLKENIMREFLDKNMNIIQKNYISLKKI